MSVWQVASAGTRALGQVLATNALPFVFMPTMSAAETLNKRHTHSNTQAKRTNLAKICCCQPNRHTTHTRLQRATQWCTHTAAAFFASFSMALKCCAFRVSLFVCGLRGVAEMGVVVVVVIVVVSTCGLSLESKNMKMLFVIHRTHI